MNPRSNNGEILIVDDTPANLDLLTNLLDEKNYAIRVALNGKQAIDSARKVSPDLILLDINMPVMNGYEVCEKLKSDPQTADIPIIFISALDEVFDKVKAFTAGGVDYITKPIQFEEVLARVKTHLALSRLQKDLEKRVTERTEALQRQMTLFRRFVPQIFTEGFEQEDLNIQEGLAREELYTVFSSDIRNFTDFSESISCVDCYRFLNAFFSVMEPGIRDQGGFVYQYVGDEIMALFKPEEGQYTDNAVRTAIAIQNHILVEYNNNRKKAGYEPVRIGIGINTGPVAIGIAGTPQRMDACAFGSTVNLAARCESLTKELNARIILTEYTYRQLKHPEAFRFRDLGPMAVRGLKEKIQLYEALEIET